MARRRFRWTRERYRKAQHLSRFFARWVYELPSERPALLQRFQDLWERHPQRDDPLTRPIRQRRADFEDSIPF
jgi:hypothetical protein